MPALPTTGTAAAFIGCLCVVALPASASVSTPPPGITYWMPPGGTHSAADIDIFWRKGSKVCATGLNYWFRGSRQGGKYLGESLNQNGAPIPSVLKVKRNGIRQRWSITETSGAPYIDPNSTQQTTKAYIRGLPNGGQSLRFWTRARICGR